MGGRMKVQQKSTKKDSWLTELILYSGIFGYINYLVEKDRKFILDTLVNGEQL